jgi:hypothetical protein
MCPLHHEYSIQKNLQLAWYGYMPPTDDFVKKGCGPGRRPSQVEVRTTSRTRSSSNGPSCRGRTNPYYPTGDLSVVQGEHG